MSGARLIVSGGTGALGQAVVKAALRDAARVAVPYRDARGFERLQSALGAPDGLFGAQAELADEASAARFVEQALAWLGGLDGLACVAGAYAGTGPLEQAPADEWTRMLEANLNSAQRLCRAALPALLKSQGSIVLVSSRLVQTGGAGAAAYAVSKAGVEALMRALAAENRARGVRANCIAPGTIDSAANRAAMPNADTRQWTPPEQLAELALYLLSARSAPLSGAVLPVEGRAPLLPGAA